MELIIQKSDLVRALAVMQSVVKGTPTIPILANVLLECTDAGLNLSATDLDVSIRTAVPLAAQVKKPGKLAIPAKKLYDYIKLLPDGPVTIKALENHWAQVRAGRSHTKMCGLDNSNFPALPATPETTVTLNAGLLRALITRTVFAVSDEASRYTLNGALLELNGSMRMVSTDGHRLALAEVKVDGIEKAGNHLIPQRCLDVLARILEGDTVAFASDDSNFYFSVGGWLLTSRKITGQFPNYSAVVPKANDKRVHLSTPEFQAAMQRVAQFSDERTGAVRLMFKPDEMVLQSSSVEAGESEEQFAITYQGAPFTIGFNSAYLLDFLKAAAAEQITADFKDGASAGVFSPVPADDNKITFQYVVMPMRV